MPMPPRIDLSNAPDSLRYIYTGLLVVYAVIMFWGAYSILKK